MFPALRSPWPLPGWRTRPILPLRCSLSMSHPSLSGTRFITPFFIPTIVAHASTSITSHLHSVGLHLHCPGSCLLFILHPAPICLIQNTRLSMLQLAHLKSVALNTSVWVRVTSQACEHTELDLLEHSSCLLYLQNPEWSVSCTVTSTQ